MDSSIVTSMPLLGLRPLGAAGDRSYPRLTDMLYARLGSAHAMLLAEPVPSPDGSRIDWYVPGQLRAVPISALPESDREGAERQLDQLRQEVFALADSLPERDAASRALATALRNAMTTPGPECCYAVPLGDGIGFQPVLVGWAHMRDGAPAYSGNLSVVKTSARKVEPKAPPLSTNALSPTSAPIALSTAPVAAAEPRMWRLRSALWLWLLFAAIVLATLWQLLRACGVTGIPWLDFCRTDAYRNVETSKLVETVRNLEHQIAARGDDCEPQGNVLDEASRRVAQRGGQTGRLQFTLIWEGYADLDIEVTCPSGEVIRQLGAGCGGGQHDVDANYREITPTPVENITWANQEAPTGRYQLRVIFYGTNQKPISRVPYSLIVRDGERQPLNFSGELTKMGEDRPTSSHDYSR